MLIKTLKTIKYGDAEKWRRRGELILANLNRIPRRASRAEVVDYFTPGTPTITIELNAGHLSPRENAEREFKRYKKAVRGRPRQLDRLRSLESEEQYLRGIVGAIELAEGPEDLLDIKAELIEEGYLQKSVVKKGRRRERAAPPAFLRRSTKRG